MHYLADVSRVKPTMGGPVSKLMTWDSNSELALEELPMASLEMEFPVPDTPMFFEEVPRT